MIWFVVVLVIVIFVLALILWVVWHDKTTVTGQPTADEARITSDAISQTALIADKAAKDVAEVEHADRKTLFDLARAKLGRMRK